jgi:hypothetical protein
VQALWFSTTPVFARLDNDSCRVGFCFRVSRQPPNCGAHFYASKRASFKLSRTIFDPLFMGHQHDCSKSAASRVSGRRCRRFVAPFHANKMFGSSSLPPLASATLQLCSIWSSFRDANPQVAHEVKDMGQPALTLPRWDMSSWNP